jgi:hypothetical protein
MDADLLRGKEAHPVKVRAASVAGFALRIGQSGRLCFQPRFTLLRSFELTHAEIDQLYSEPSGKSIPS